jgi:hypothetical protein
LIVRKVTIIVPNAYTAIAIYANILLGSYPKRFSWSTILILLRKFEYRWKCGEDGFGGDKNVEEN